MCSYGGNYMRKYGILLQCSVSKGNLHCKCVLSIFQQVSTNFTQPYLHWLLSTCFFMLTTNLIFKFLSLLTIVPLGKALCKRGKAGRIWFHCGLSTSRDPEMTCHLALRFFRDIADPEALVYYSNYFRNHAAFETS